MRITNQMQSNRLLQNIGRSQSLVDTLYNQMTSGSKILLPSDDPIVATRALKFRSNIARTEQYITNVTQGQAWLEITEGGYSSTDEILKDLRDQLVYGGTDTFRYEDRHKFAASIEELQRQLSNEMNIDYAGRYVFSGLRTDEPAVIIREEATANFRIHQTFEVEDLEFARLFTTEDDVSAPELQDVYRFKLPYRDVVGMDFTGNAGLTAAELEGLPASSVAMPAGFTIVDVSTDATIAQEDYHNPPDGTVYFIPSTGEFVVGAGDKNANINAFKEAISDNGFNITYEKNGLSEGDLNPRVYFNCEESAVEFSDGTIRDRIFRTNNQDLDFEFGVSTRITVNSKANETYTSWLYSDIRALTELLNRCETSTKADLVQKYISDGMSDEEANEAAGEQLVEEAATYRTVMQKAFSNMLGRVEGHIVKLNTEMSKVGTKMVSLDLIGKRLDDDRTSYTNLKNENESVDYVETMMYLSTAEYVYSAALKIGGSIAQMSLMDYIR